jgi:hypothetical protein
MKPASGSLLFGVCVVAVLVIASAAGVIRETRKVASANSLQQLRVAGIVETELQANRLQELQLRADVLANDVAFVDYVAQSLLPSAQLGGAVDSASISDLLTERRHGYDIAAVLDPTGKLVATSGILLRDPSGVQHDPLVAKAIRSLAPVRGTWVDHGQLLWVVVNPLLRGGALQGVLLSAAHVDNGFATTVSRIARTSVAFVIQPSPGSLQAPASDVQDWAAQALSSQVPAVLALTATGPLTLADGQHQSTVWVTPLDTAGGRAALVALDPAAGSDGIVNRASRPWLAGIAALGVFGLLLVMLLWRRTWLPLQQMLDVIERAADTGDNNLTVRVEGSTIVRRLRDGINRLLQANHSV